MVKRVKPNLTRIHVTVLYTRSILSAIAIHPFPPSMLPNSLSPIISTGLDVPLLYSGCWFHTKPNTEFARRTVYCEPHESTRTLGRNAVVTIAFSYPSFLLVRQPY